MRKGILFSGLSAVMLIGAIVWFGNTASNKEYYQPRSVEHAEGADGAASYLARIRANQVTGTIDPADYRQAHQQVSAMAKNKQGNLNLQWSFEGPDNLGGRSRAFIFDKDDPSIMYMGSVSGGLYKSTNGGRSWNPIGDAMDNLAVVSLTQAANGDIYVGTGEGMYYASSGLKVQGILGNGIYKSTDGGQTFTQLSSTLPNGVSSPWTAVGKLESDPNNANRIYAATRGGFYVSDDAGATWTAGVSGSGICRDMTITPSGNIWLKQGLRSFKSDASGSNFTEISGGVLPRTGSRMRFAVSPQDENYAYAIEVDGNGRFAAAYQTTDGGATWKTIGTFNLLLNPHNNQGNYNNAVAVDPKDKERILVGGVELWEWSENEGWFQIATLSRFSQSFYVHADNHEIKFHPTDQNKLFVANDGGLFKSTDNGFTWTMENKGYGTIQFYGIDVNYRKQILGGTQDNSNILIDPTQPLPTSGLRVFSGDGGQTALSDLDPEIAFLESQYGNMVRTVDGGSSFGGFFSPRVTNLRGSAIGVSQSFADFVAPMALHETMSDEKSADSIRVGADTITANIFGNGGTSYTGNFFKQYSSIKFDAASFTATTGSQVVVSDAQGNLSGDGSGTFDANTGTFNVTFNTPTSLPIRFESATRFDAGAVIQLESLTGEIPFTDTLTNGLNPGEEVMIQDPIGSLFAIGITAYDDPNKPLNQAGGVWVTREALSDRNNSTVEWWHVGKMNDEERPVAMSISGDGDRILVGTNEGRVYMISNLDNARSEETADIDYDYSTGNPIPSNAVVQQKVVFSRFGRAITSCSFDPDDNSRIIVTLGNYGNNDYVYYTDQGNNPNLSSGMFDDITGNLPDLPVYDALFNYKDASDGQVILGTDLGIFATSDVDAATVNWTVENGSFPPVPTFDILQTRTVRYDLVSSQDFEGSLYVGTHGRGAWKSNTTAGYIGIEDEPVAEPKKVAPVLGLYPNPAKKYVNVELDLSEKSDVELTIRDLTGKLVKRISVNGVSRHTPSLEISVEGMKTGNYIITAFDGKTSRSGKLVVTK